MALYKEVFKAFFKIGIGTIGGGFAMIPMMEQEIVHRHHWLSEEEFVDVLALSQASPGVFAVNLSSHIGYKLGGIKLSILAALANILPSILIILTFAIVLKEFRDNTYVNHCFMAIRPVVVGLIISVVYSLIKKTPLNSKTAFLPIITIVLIYFLHISPVYIIMLGLSFGLFYSLYLSYNNKKKGLKL